MCLILNMNISYSYYQELFVIILLKIIKVNFAMLFIRIDSYNLIK
jgi:hypothetical protein